MSSDTKQDEGACSCEGAAQRMLYEITHTFTRPAKQLADVACQLRDLPYRREPFAQKEKRLERLSHAWDITAENFIRKGNILYVGVPHAQRINAIDQPVANRIHTQE